MLHLRAAVRPASSELSVGGAAIPSEPITADQVISICRRLWDQQGFQNWRSRNTNRDALRYEEAPVDIAGIPQLLEFRSPAINQHGLRYVNKFDGATFSIDVAARSAEPAARDAAQRTENFDFHFYHDFRRRFSDPFRRRCDQATFKGAGILHLDFNMKDPALPLLGRQFKTDAELRAALSKASDAKFTRNPFIIECPDLGACAWEPDMSVFCEMGEQAVSRLSEVYFSETKEDWPDWLTSETMEEGTGGNIYQQVAKIYHLETEQFICDVAERGTGSGDSWSSSGDSYMLQYRPNIAGRPWYTIMAGQLGSSFEPDKLYLPVISSLYSIVQLYNITGTLTMSGALNTGRNMWQLVRMGRPPDNFMDIVQNKAWQQDVNIKVDISGEMLANPPDGFEWKPVPIPDQQQLRNAHQDLKQEIMENGFPAVLYDQPHDQQASSGYQTSKQQEAVNQQLEPTLRNMARADDTLFRLIHDVIKELDLPVTIPVHRRGGDKKVQEATTLRPRDIKEVDILIDYKSVPASVAMAQQEADSRLLTQGLMSRQTFMGRRYDDPEAEDERIFVDQVAELEKQKAMAVIDQILTEQAADIAAEASAEVGLPLPPLAQPAGGPAPGEDVRMERPAMGAFPAVGAPMVPPGQTPPGEVAPPEMGGGFAAEGVPVG